MLLLIDSGNTRIKWALVDPSLRRQAPQSFSTAQPVDWIAYGVVLQTERDRLATAWSTLSITRAVIANVAGDDVRQQLSQILQIACALAPEQIDWFASVAAAAGIRNGYRNPSQLGCDRFASLIGARALLPAQRLIVATCGTATTIDALEADGHFLGGLILPGPVLMAQSLARQTAQLPQIGDAFIIPPLFADHTEAAIQSGCLTAQSGAILQALAVHVGARCILSGGAARFIAPRLDQPHHVIDNLVLRGLQASTWTADPC
jgi:type III pantothenate kinase